MRPNSMRAGGQTAKQTRLNIARTKKPSGVAAAKRWLRGQHKPNEHNALEGNGCLLSPKIPSPCETMPAPLIETPARARFERLLERYLQVNTRNAPELVTKKAKTVTVELYRAAVAAAPSPAQIARDVKARGWRAKRRKGGWPLRKGEKRGSQGPLKRMQAAVVRRRQRAIGAAAAGFLPALTALGAKPGGRVASTFKHPKGKLEVLSTTGTAPAVAVVNQQPGIVTVEKKHAIRRTAYNAASKDVLTYLKRKQTEALQAAKR